MSFDQSFLHEDAQRHVARNFPPPYKVMERMETEIAQSRQPAVGRGTGSILRTLVAASKANRILEVGTNVGYSTLWLASELPPNGRLDTIELNSEFVKKARENIREANPNFAGRVVVHEGAALDVLAHLNDPYDFIFLDAVKAEYPRYLDHALRVSQRGTVIAADNAFWGGGAWAPADSLTEDDHDTRGIQAYTRRVTTDARLATTLVPSEDGLLVSVVR